MTTWCTAVWQNDRASRTGNEALARPADGSTEDKMADNTPQRQDTRMDEFRQMVTQWPEYDQRVLPSR